MKKKMKHIVLPLCVALGILYVGFVSRTTGVLAATVGDVNSDSVVDSGDVDDLRKYLVGETVTDFVASNAEVTMEAESTVNLADLVRLIRYTTEADTSWYEEENKKTDSNGDYYEISDLADLLGLAEITTFDDKEIRLANDIIVNPESAVTYNAAGTAMVTNGLHINWTPVKNFKGKFDGGNHTISGLYSPAAVSSANGKGVFGTVDSATIENLTVERGYFAKNITGQGLGFIGVGNGTFENIKVDLLFVQTEQTLGNVGGIIGMANGETTVTNCWSDSRITSGGMQVGGIMGSAEGNKVTISSCLNSGEIKMNASNKAGARMGGILGVGAKAASAQEILIEDCLNVGRVVSAKTEDGHTGAIIGWVNNQSTAPKHVTLNNFGYVAYPESTTETIARATACTAENVKYGLNSYIGPTSAESTDQNISGYGSIAIFTTLNWDKYWTVQKDSTPVLTSFAPEGKVNVPDVDTTWYQADATTEYTLVTKQQLRGLSELSKTETFEGKTIKLGKALELNTGEVADWAEEPPQITWEPIQNFAGTFDGQGHTIKGVYMNNDSSTLGAGLFTNVNNATIHDLKVENSYIAGNITKGIGVIGTGSGTFTEIYADVIMDGTSATGRGNLGGILGCATGETTISNCWSENTITCGVKGRIGGIVGFCNQQKVTVSHCLNTGDVSSTISDVGYIGGIVGAACFAVNGIYTGYQDILIEDCFNTGKVTVAKENAAAIGGVLGAAGTGSGSDTVKPPVTVRNSYFISYENDNPSVQSVAISVLDSEDGITAIDSGTGTSEEMCDEDCLSTFENLNWYFTTENPNGYWLARKSKSPILKCFASQGELDEALGMNVATAYGTQVPTYVTTNGTVTAVIHVGYWEYEVGVQNTTLTECQTYASALENAGYTLYSKKETSAGSSVSEKNVFYTYKKEGTHIFLSYHPNMKTARVVMTPEDALPSLTAPTITSSDTITPSLIQMKLGVQGMQFVAQLADGSFIIVDGGINSETDMDNLYSYLYAKKNPTHTKPKIAAWYFTHPHVDHIGLATDFLKKYAGMITVDSFAYNFAASDFKPTIENDSSIVPLYRTLENTIMNLYSSATIYTIHAGQTYYYKGMQLEILMTEEELYPTDSQIYYDGVWTWNNTSANFRMTFDNGETALFLADSQREDCRLLANLYGDYLKSDMLQLAHHGGEYGGVKVTYELIAPDVCFWTCSEAEYEASKEYDYNKYVLSIANSRHYRNDNGVTVLFKEDETVFQTVE